MKKKNYSTRCDLLSDLSTEEEVVSDGVLLQIPAHVSYHEQGKIIEIKLTLHSQEEFLITKELLSHSYLENDSFYIPLTRTPYLDISLAQFQDPFMVQLGRGHLQSPKINQLTPSQFYGTKSLTTSSSIFSIFPRQDLAFQYFDSQNSKKDLKIFSFEAPFSGKRKFLVSHLNIFHEKYRDNVNRHVYEIICEAFPCRLYFDLEYSKETNPEAHGESIVELWISLVVWKLYELYELVISSKQIIHLDSSTDKKFSRHLIFLLLIPDPPQRTERQRASPISSHLHRSSSLPSLLGYSEYLFVDNLEVGKFVNFVLLSCLSPVASLPPQSPSPQSPSPQSPSPSFPLPSTSTSTSTSTLPSDGIWTLPRQFRDLQVKESFSSLWLWNSDHTSRVCVVDLGVYTKNRAFRLLSSTKYGKNAKLEIQRVSETKLRNQQIPPPPPAPASVTTEPMISEQSLMEGRGEGDESDLGSFFVPGLGEETNDLDMDQVQRRRKESHQKMVSEFTNRFNYFVSVASASSSLVLSFPPLIPPLPSVGALCLKDRSLLTLRLMFWREPL
jgi:hypothetical protein